MRNKKQILKQTNDAQKVYDVKRMFFGDETTEEALKCKFISIVKSTLEYVVIGGNSKEEEIVKEAKQLLDNCNDFIGAMRGFGFLLKLSETL